MKRLRVMYVLPFLVIGILNTSILFAQEADESDIDAPEINVEPVSSPPPERVASEAAAKPDEPSIPKPAFAPVNSASIWNMTNTSPVSTLDFEKLDIARDPGADVTKGRERPVANSVFFGVPPKSAMSVITLGVAGTDVDQFLSTTAFSNVSYKSAFGYIGFDRDALSVGVSSKLGSASLASLYYNGNIVEDIFAYIANNSLTNGKVGLSADEDSYDFIGDLKDRNNINSRNNIDLLLGTGKLGIDLGYSQKLFGLRKKSDPEPQLKQEDGGTGYNQIINNTLEAILDNALVPHVEVGLQFNIANIPFKGALGFQLDIHQHREFSGGEIFKLPVTSNTDLTPFGNWSREVSTSKLSADYTEPAFALRLEADIPSDNNSRLGFVFETGLRMKFYSNLDDRAEPQPGIYWSQKTDSNFEYSITEKSSTDLFIRPSVRFLARIMNVVKVGLSGGFGFGFNFGEETTKTKSIYSVKGYDEYLREDTSNENDKRESSSTPTTVGIYPNLGIGFSFDIVPNIFTLNGGVGATQTLYSLTTGKVEIKEYEQDGTEKAPEDQPPPKSLFQQVWGKPLAQFALGATFTFKQNFTLDAMFSSNGTSFDDANFVVQFSAKF